MSPDLKGHRALGTGASSGIGAAMARRLAEWGAAVVLVARREDRLQELAGELREKHGATVDVVALDLLGEGAAEQLLERTRAGGPVTILVNNAGFAVFRAFHESSWSNQDSMMRLNVLVLMELTHRFLPQMLARRDPSYVLNVASIGAYQPVPFMAAYAASKAFVRNFTEALAFELKDTPVSVTSLCPGGTRTEFFDVAQQTPSSSVERLMMSAERCADIGLKAMLRGRPNVISGGLNKLGMWLTRFAPRRGNTRMAHVVIGAPPEGE